MIVTTHDVFCDLCNNHIGDTTLGVVEARRIASRAGWVRYPSLKIDLCPKCAAKRKAASREAEGGGDE
jgi:hypothetical protein